MSERATIRRATLDDVPAIRAILAAHDNDGPVTTVDIVGPYVRHLVEHATALVSQQAGEVVAFGATIDAGVATHLTDLFVRPDLLGRGIGWPLLEAAFDAAPDPAAPRTTFASNDPRALPLYVRAGMRPFWPLLSLEGSTAGLPAPDPTLSLEPADAARLAGLERSWTGAERLVDHVFWASQAEADTFVVLDAGEPVAFAYARARQIGVARAVDRLLVRPDADPVRPTLAAIRRAGRGGPVMATVPGPSPLLAVLLRAGFRITGRDQYMGSDPGIVDPARRIPNGGML